MKTNGKTEFPIEAIKKYVRAANYLTAAQIYLQNNFLLKTPLTFEDIKPRLLGHWGTCPGVNFIYVNLNYLIKKYNQESLFILGPGHGFAGLQANLFLEGTLQKYYPEAKRTESGIAYIAKNFSWPYGFPSHSNPGTPGVILEGGELGYSLATAYGAAFDKPDLLVVCIVGDGEAETGPAATAWHLNKFLNPKDSGAVLPILHLNGYKISGPTIFGRMSNEELYSLFSGYGYEPMMVDEEEEEYGIYEHMAETLEECYQKIRAIQNETRQGSGKLPARFPMIILRTPKGWTGIKNLKGQKIEGNFLSHQVVVPNAKTDPGELKALKEWLLSYKFEELFDSVAGFDEDIRSLIPKDELCMGQSKYAIGGDPVYQPLSLPDAKKFTEEVAHPGVIGSSSMRRAGAYLEEVMRLNEKDKNFRFFSPDETYSNKLDQIFRATTRVFTWPLKPWDKDWSDSGRVVEMLSEHSLQGMMQGYVLTGRHAVFASYEAFIQIVASMADQYSKFLSVTESIQWRGLFPSLNYILTSSGWRQEHNGFSHQNPGFIDDMLRKSGCFVNVYFPPDGNSTLAVLDLSLRSVRSINIIVAGKTLEPRWLSLEEAKEELERGLMIWKFASDPNPDIVVAAVGDYLTKEALASIDIVKKETPEVKIRFVNILALSAVGLGDMSCRVPFHDFEDFFTHDKPVIFNFHGYPQTLKQILFDYGNDKNRFSVHGYIEHGSTTTPFDMHVRNKTSRYHLALEIFEKMGERGVLINSEADKLKDKYQQKLTEHYAYILKNGVDPEEIENWTWQKNI